MGLQKLGWPSGRRRGNGATEDVASLRGSDVGVSARAEIFPAGWAMRTTGSS